MTEDSSSHGADRTASSGTNPRAAAFTQQEVISAGLIGMTRRFWLGIGITLVYGSISSVDVVALSPDAPLQNPPSVRSVGGQRTDRCRDS